MLSDQFLWQRFRKRPLPMTRTVGVTVAPSYNTVARVREMKNGGVCVVETMASDGSSSITKLAVVQRSGLLKLI